MSRGGAWDEKHRLALAAGALGFFIALAPLSELDAARADNATGDDAGRVGGSGAVGGAVVAGGKTDGKRING